MFRVSGNMELWAVATTLHARTAMQMSHNQISNWVSRLTSGSVDARPIRHQILPYWVVECPSGLLKIYQSLHHTQRAHRC
jgi:hypothetical protein